MDEFPGLWPCKKKQNKHKQKNKMGGMDWGEELEDWAFVSFSKSKSYLHLYTPTDQQVWQMPEETIWGIVQDAQKLNSPPPPLALWQKINALNTFLIPDISFILRHLTVPHKHLKEVEGEIKQVPKKWMNLLLCNSNEILHIPCRAGGCKHLLHERPLWHHNS